MCEIKILVLPVVEILLVLQELPELHPLPGVRVSGCAFASCLMVVEFMHNFGAALGFGKYGNNVVFGTIIWWCIITIN